MSSPRTIARDIVCGMWAGLRAIERDVWLSGLLAGALTGLALWLILY